MAVETLTATKRSNLSTVNSPQVETLPGVNMIESTVEVTAAASATSTYFIAHLPSNARISGLSRMMHDDLASTGAPTIDIGTYNAADGTANDADAINDGIDVATAASNDVAFVKDPANVGKYLWQLAGCSTDPGGFIDIKAALVDADANTGGTMSFSIIYRIE